MMLEAWIIDELKKREERQRSYDWGPIPLYIEDPRAYAPPQPAPPREDERDDDEDGSHVIIIDIS